MGRLFWKCFLATWITLNLIAILIFSGIHMYRQAEREAQIFMRGPRADFELAAAESLLVHAGPAASMAVKSSGPFGLDPVGAPDPKWPTYSGNTQMSQYY